MTTRRRAPLPLLVSLAIHVAVGALLLNIIVFHYDFSSLRPVRMPAEPMERITYVSVGPPAGALGGRGTSAPARADGPGRALAAPARVPMSLPAIAPIGRGTPGGVAGGRGVGGGVGPATGIVAGDPDPRLLSQPHVFYPVPKSHAERVDSAVKATILAFNDSVARASSGRKPGDWTFGKDGSKWGLDGNKIYLGKFAIPSAVLAALPIHIQGNPGAANADRLASTRRGDVMLHAASAEHDDDFGASMKRIRERKDRERREKEQKAAADAKYEGH